MGGGAQRTSVHRARTHTQRGLRVLEEGLAAHTTTRSALQRPYYFVLLAGALMRVGEHERSQSALDESARVAEATGQHAYAAEHARLQAELYVSRGSSGDSVEEKYGEALAISRRHGARVARTTCGQGLRTRARRSGPHVGSARRSAAGPQPVHRRPRDARCRIRRSVAQDVVGFRLQASAPPAWNIVNSHRSVRTS